MVHILPHWNWNGCEGERIRVSCYTNCDHVRLLLNGDEIGIQTVERYGHAEWNVPYKAGRLEAEGYRNGEQVCRDVCETTGEPVRMRMELVCMDENIAMLHCVCLDADGRTVPDAAPTVSFMTNECGTILATGSDICDHVPVTSSIRAMRAGMISVLVRLGNQRGTLRVHAKADGMPIAHIEIPLP